MPPRPSPSWPRYVLLLSLAGVVPRAHAQAAQQVPDARLQQRLTALYTSMLTGIRDRDTVALRSVLSPRYIYAPGDSGTVRNRSRRFVSIASDPDSIEVLDLDRCTFKPGTATRIEAECIVHQLGTFNRERWDTRVKSNVSFVREPRGWRIASTRTQIVPGTAKQVPPAP